MKFGIVMFPTDYAIRPDDLARACEERGFESLWFPEHTHIPASRRTPWPGGGELPKEYSHTYDPFVALDGGGGGDRARSSSAPASASSSSATRSPPRRRSRRSTCSRTAASCSASAAAGTSRRWRTTAPTSSTRWKLLRERVVAMKEIWTKDEAEYHGEFVNFDPIWSWPKPVQKPHPPILLGGARRRARPARRRVLRRLDARSASR